MSVIDHTHGDDSGNEWLEFSKAGKCCTNQFWWGGMVVSKEHLTATVQSFFRLHPEEDCSWFPLSFDLSKPDQLESFIAEVSQITFTTHIVCFYLCS